MSPLSLMLLSGFICLICLECFSLCLYSHSKGYLLYKFMITMELVTDLSSLWKKISLLLISHCRVKIWKGHIGTDTYCAFDFKINEKQTNMSLSDEFCLGHTHQSLISQDKLLQREDFHVHRRNAEILSILYILGVFPLLSISRPLCVLKLCLEKEVINIKALHKFLRMIWDFFLFILS